MRGTGAYDFPDDSALGGVPREREPEVDEKRKEKEEEEEEEERKRSARQFINR